MLDLLFWFVVVLLIGAVLAVTLEGDRLDDEPPTLDTRGPDDR